MYFLGERDWIIIGVCTAALVLGVTFLFIFIGNIESSTTEEKIDDTTIDFIEEESSFEEIEEIESGEIINPIEEEVIVKEEPLIEFENKSEEIIFKSIALSTKSIEETILLEKENRKLNLNEKLVDVFGKYVWSEDLPIFLGNDIEIFNAYVQKIEISEDVEIKRFSDDEYDDGEYTNGFNFSRNDLILDYKIEFIDELSWDELIGKNIFILGRDYEIISADYISRSITLLESPYSLILKEGEILEFETPKGKNNLSIHFLNKDYVSMEVNKEEIKRLYEGEDYVGENFEIKIKSIMFLDKNANNKIEVTISPKRLIFDGGDLKYNSEEIEGIETSFISTSEDSLDAIEVSWKLSEDSFLTSTTTLTMPFFETISLTMSGKKVDERSNYYWEIFLNTNKYTSAWE